MGRFAAGFVVGSVATIVYAIYEFNRMTTEAFEEIRDRYEAVNG